MSGVIVAMRRTLLSCTSLARNGLIGTALAALLPAAPADAADFDGVANKLETHFSEAPGEGD